MENFLHSAFAFPTVIFSFLLCLAVLYWCVAALGILEVDVLDIEADSTLESVQPEGLAGLLLKLGLNGVPVTLVLTLLFFFAWSASYFVELLLLRHLPLGILRYPLGLVLVGTPAALAASYTGEDGRENPFLHLAMHLSRIQRPAALLAGPHCVVQPGASAEPSGVPG